MSADTVSQASTSLSATPLPKEPTVKKAPGTRIPGHALKLQYNASPSGFDSNLLIFLHGLGDTSQPFFDLGKRLQKTLPQTAVLSVQGSQRIPILPEEAWCYWDCIDPVMGGMVTHPNPSGFLTAFGALVDHLVTECGWPSTAIHFFGFAHGATAVAEGVISWTRIRRQAQEKLRDSATQQQDSTTSWDKFGSIVTICGSLLSVSNCGRLDFSCLFENHQPSDIMVCLNTFSLQHPTFSPPLGAPLLNWHHAQAPGTRKDLTRAFSNVQDHTASSAQVEAMPASKAEWDPIMHFWSKMLRNRSEWERSGDVYTVTPQ